MRGSDAENYNRIAPEIDYGTHIPEWINGTTFELRISTADVAKNSVRRIHYTP